MVVRERRKVSKPFVAGITVRLHTRQPKEEEGEKRKGNAGSSAVTGSTTAVAIETRLQNTQQRSLERSSSAAVQSHSSEPERQQRRRETGLCKLGTWPGRDKDGSLQKGLEKAHKID